MDLSLVALWYVCALGAGVFAAAAPPSRLGSVGGALAFAVGSWWIHQPFAPWTASVGLIAAVAAFWCLIRPVGHTAVATSGLLAGIWSGVLARQGVPLIPALVLAASLPIVSGYLRAGRRGFAPPVLRDEALLLLVMLGVSAAALPGVIDGWYAAANLSVQGGPSTGGGPVLLPTWTLALTCAALMAGGFLSLWSRR